MMLATTGLMLIALASSHPVANIIDNVEHISFLNGLVNSMIKGEGGLKETCYQVHNSSENMSIFEKEQCRQAMKEIELAKRQYPKALGFVSKFKQGINGEELGKQLDFYSSASIFKKDCKSELNTRAAKTMRYWGTQEVGKWHYTNLKEMGADQYKLVLQACKEDSWVDIEKRAIDKNLSEFWGEVVNGKKLEGCSPASNQNQWTKVLHESNKTINQKALMHIAAIDTLLSSNDSIDTLFDGYKTNDAFNRKKELQKVSTYCVSLIGFGDRALASQERAKQQQQRILQAKQQAAAEAVRQDQLRRAAQERQKQVNQRANDGVVLD